MKNGIIFIITLLIVMPAFAQQTVQAGGALSFQKEKDMDISENSGFKTKYILLSLVLPGSGEWLMGNRNLAKVFLISDVSLWAGYFGLHEYINVLEKDYQTFAAVHAGTNTVGKDEQYWIDIGVSSDIYSFNEEKRVERNLEAAYPETDLYAWQWDSQQNRYKFNDYRFKRHDWKQRLNIVIGGLILNRIVSAVDVIRLIRKEKKAGQEQFSRLYFDYQNNRFQGELYRLNLSLRW